jgi:hypothetical protein
VHIVVDRMGVMLRLRSYRRRFPKGQKGDLWSAQRGKWVRAIRLAGAWNWISMPTLLPPVKAPSNDPYDVFE